MKICVFGSGVDGITSACLLIFITWRFYNGKEKESSKEENRGKEASQEENNQKEEKIKFCMVREKGRRCICIDGLFLLLTSPTYLIAKFVV